jgi:hypothetical protein
MEGSRHRRRVSALTSKFSYGRIVPNGLEGAQTMPGWCYKSHAGTASFIDA